MGGFVSLATLHTLERANREFIFHGRTLWLFTFSDFKTILIPSFVFGIANALAAHAYQLPVLYHVNSTDLFRKSPFVLLWIWLNLLPFNINNQRTSSAIAEDTINKPWRPIPSGRLSSDQAKYIMLSFYIFAQLFSLFISGGLRQGICLLFLGIWYNNLGGADGHYLIRNSTNALGFLCFISGAMEVALGTSLPLSGSSRMVNWFGVIAGIVLTTVHTQDMYDQEGDALRRRSTVPLDLGDATARWTIAVPMVAWGTLCPMFWGANFAAHALSLAMATSVGIRSVAYRNVSSDRKTFLIWNIWLSFVYILPLCGAR